MNNIDKKIRPVDVNQEDTYLQLFPYGSFIHKYETGLDGLGMRHNRHPACEYPEHYIQQNAIVIHLRPELGSERRLDNCLQIENVSVGEVAIVPAYVKGSHKNFFRRKKFLWVPVNH
ncbi:MAG: hypothetical protein AAF915_11315 [Cyanobacteria bacterium P01_D01_bin.50]